MAEITLDRLDALLKCNSRTRSSVEVYFIDSYDEFLAYVYKHLDRIISIIQKNSNQYSALMHIEGASVLSEDLMTTIIIDLLGQNNLNASSKVVGGNVDIVVEMEGNDYQWLCEAKLDNNVDHVAEGFLQLTTRYASVEREDREGGVLVYHRKHSLDFMNDIKNELPAIERLAQYDIQIKRCSLRPEFSFFTESLSPSTGGEHRYRARFMGVQLLFDPRDKSGVKAKYLIARRESIASLEN